MKRWLRRLFYVVLLTVWLIVMGFPTLAFFLATQGDIRLGSEDGSYLRLFLIREEENQGVSLEWSQRPGRAPSCRQGNVYYFLWKGAGENVAYCQCQDPVTGEVLSAERGRCNVP